MVPHQTALFYAIRVKSFYLLSKYMAIIRQRNITKRFSDDSVAEFSSIYRIFRYKAHLKFETTFFYFSVYSPNYVHHLFLKNKKTFSKYVT